MLSKHELRGAVLKCLAGSCIGQARFQGSSVNMLGKHELKEAGSICWASMSSGKLCKYVVQA